MGGIPNGVGVWDEVEVCNGVGVLLLLWSF